MPSPRLLPDNPLARVLAVAHGVAVDIHPVNNLHIVQTLRDFPGLDAARWMARAADALEQMVDPSTPFAFGHSRDLADLCITAQVDNGHRRDLDLNPYPAIARIADACLALPPIRAAHPNMQPDAEVSP